MMWEPVPKPRKRPVEDLEARLRTIRPALARHRIYVGTHAPRVWTFGWSAGGIGLMTTSAALTALGPLVAIPFYLGLGAILIGMLWPTYFRRCTCQRCEPTDLR